MTLSEMVKTAHAANLKKLSSQTKPLGNESQIAFLDELEKISFQLNDVADFGRAAGRAGADAAKRFSHAANPKNWQVRKGLEGAGKNMAGAVGTFSNPRKSLAEGWKATMKPGGKPLHPAYKALMAAQIAGGLVDVAHKEDPLGQGRSRFRRAAGFVGDTAGGVMAAPFGVTGGIVGSMVGRKLGDTVGAVGDRLTGRGRPTRVAHPPSLPPRPVGLQE